MLKFLAHFCIHVECPKFFFSCVIVYMIRTFNDFELYELSVNYDDALVSSLCCVSCCNELLSTLTCNDIVLCDSCCYELVGVAFIAIFRRPLRTPHAFGRGICSH